MKNPFIQNTHIGVLGGGQLGRMMIEAVNPLGIDLHILDPDPEAPCKDIAKTFTVGDLKDFDTVYAFGKDKDVVTIEIEHVNVEALKKLQAEGILVYPQPEKLELIQDKGLQKAFYKEHDIPTSPYTLWDKGQPIPEGTSFPLIQKTRTGGYDGKGVQKVATKEDLWEAPSILEEAVDIDMEISVIVARSASGEIKTYPAVEMVFDPKINLVDYLLSPAQITEQQERKAQELALKVADKMKIVGLLAVEMFLDQDGNILVNEVAPRPHNSGHQTIEGNATSQFEQHVRAILDLPLGDTQTITQSGMVNLIGKDGYTGPAQYQGMKELLTLSGIYPHLYGKALTKPFRKMGHITLTGDTRNEVIEKIEKVKEKISVVSLKD